MRSGTSLHVPVYFYEAAAKRPDRVNLENIRRGQFEALVQEIGVVPDSPSRLRRRAAIPPPAPPSSARANS